MKRHAEFDLEKIKKKAKILDMLIEKKRKADSDSELELGDDLLKFFSAEAPKIMHASGSGSKVYHKDNRVYFKTDVSDDSVAELIKILDAKNEEYDKLIKNKLIESAEPSPIYLHITSYGGSVFAGMRAVDAIQRSTIPVHTVVDGYAASAATLMSVVGEKRYMTPHSYVLIHELRSAVWGKMTEMEEEVENCKMIMEDICKIYVENTKITKPVLTKQLKHDAWWGIDECIKKGLVDEAYDSSL